MPAPDPGERGQASVEVVALLPVLVLVALRSGRRSSRVRRCGSRAPRRGPRPGPAPSGPTRAPRRGRAAAALERGLRVREGDEADGVAVTLRIPSVLGDGAIASTTARARFVPQGA